MLLGSYLDGMTIYLVLLKITWGRAAANRFSPKETILVLFENPIRPFHHLFLLLNFLFR